MARPLTEDGLIDHPSLGTFHFLCTTPVLYPRRPLPALRLSPAQTLVNWSRHGQAPQVFLEGGRRQRSLSPRGKPPGRSTRELQSSALPGPPGDW